MKSIVRFALAGAAASTLWMAPAFAAEGAAPRAAQEHAGCTCQHATQEHAGSTCCRQATPDQARPAPDPAQATVDYGGYKV